MFVLHLPVARVHREEAFALFAEKEVPDRLDGECFVLVCNRARCLSESYVDAIVEQALDRGVAEIALVGVETYLLEYAQDAAWRRGVPDKVAKRRAVEVGV